MNIINKNIDSIQNIFQTIHHIDNEFQKVKSGIGANNGFVSIIFDSEIRFINPFFLSLLLLTHEKYIDNNLALVMDILDFNDERGYKKGKDPRQYYVFRFLLPFFNSPYFKLELKEKEKINYLRDSYKEVISDGIKRHIFIDINGKSYKKLIYLFCSKKPDDRLFLNISGSGTFLPILKLTNYTNFYYDESFYNDSKDKFNRRKDIFKSLTLDNEKNLVNLRETFADKFITYVKPKNFDNTLLNPLKDVFFEMVDNIKRHAQYKDKSFADSYFNFYYDNVHENFNFHIMDNFHTGLINTYVKTLKSDSDTLNEVGLNGTDIYMEANESLKDSTNDIAFLEALFSEGGWFHGNQIPRVILHFGMPLLAKIIKDTEGSAYIRLYRKTDEGNIFYEVILNKEGTKVKDITGTCENIEGTYISITIPNTKYQGLTPTSMVLSNDDYRNISNKEDEIVQRVKEFTTESKKVGKKTCAIYNYEEYTKGTISDFIRKIYIDAYVNETKDILVIGINLKDFEDYFATLIYLLYSNDEDKERSDTPYMVRNILFWDKTSFDILFIGGKTKDEFYTSTKILNKHYGQQTDCLNRIELSEDLTTPADSIFFFKTGVDFMVIPFETIGKEIQNYDNVLENISVQRTIIGHLEKTKETIHFDTKQHVHVDVYYKFDTIFQDSKYFGRIAYELKNIIIEDNILKGKQIVFIGIGKYLNLFMALLVQNFEKEEIGIYKKYEVFNSENGDDDKIEKFIKNVKTDNVKVEIVFVLVTAVSFGGKKIEEFRNKYLTDCHVYWYNTIQIGLEGITLENSHFKARKNIINIEIPKKRYHIVKDVYCKICKSPDSELPLLTLDDNDEFKLKKTYFNKYEPKKFINRNNIDSLKWYNTIAFGHIKRGSSNHYLYYTKTIQFFNDNEKKIYKCLKTLRRLKIVENPVNTIIIIPMHSTLNKFTSLVHKMVFNSKAKIFQLDKQKGIKNYHELKSQIEDPSRYKFYFIDDEISSGATLEYFYSLLRYLGVDGFERIFIMIDRMDSVDERLSLNYLNDKDEKNIHCFSKMEIKPIKTAVEDCFLCETRHMYGEILKQTSLDMNRFAIAERIVKLNLLDANFIDFEDSKDLTVSKFRIYLKMYAVDYIYENFDEIYFDYQDEYYDRAIILKRYQDFESVFIGKVQGKINTLNFNGKTIYGSLLNDIGEYEGRIALLKALSFPKLVYYYSLRYMLTIVLLDNMRNYIKKTVVAYYFNYYKMRSFIDVQEDKKYQVFLEHFHKKVNMNYLSFLHKTASYLDIHYVIHKDNVAYYHKASKLIKDRDKGKGNDVHALNQSLVEYYQLAAKRVASYSNGRAKYLKENIESVLEGNKNRDNGYDKLLGALLIENHYDEDIVIFQKKCREIFIQENDITKIISRIEDILKVMLKNDTIKFHAIYVNQYANLLYKTYAEYIRKIKLVNVMGDYSEPLKKEDDLIYRLTKGYLSKFKQETFNPENLEHKKYIHNTWSNKYIENYILKNDKEIPVTTVKLVDINPKNLDKTCREDSGLKTLVSNNNTLWYKPIGTVVITYEKDTDERSMQNLHWMLSKYILSIQNEFVQYLNERFSYGVIQESVGKQELKEYIGNYNHNIGNLLNISEPFKNRISNYYNLLDEPIRQQASTMDFLEQSSSQKKTNREELASGIELLKDYLYAPPLIARVAQLGSKTRIDKPKNVDILMQIKDKKVQIIKSIKSMQKIANVIGFINSFDLVIDDDSDESFIVEGTNEDDMRSIIFELCFNASKYSGMNILISFKSKDNTLTITNKIGMISESNRTTMGQSAIIEYLKRIGYNIVFPNKSLIKIENEYVIEIRKKD